MALERESIMVTDMLDIQRLFASWKSQSARRGVDIQCVHTVDYIIVVTRSSQIAAKERLSMSARALESLVTVVRST